MTKSLRARLFAGLTAIILLAGCLGGVFTYLWAFDEAIEMQDSILIQIGSLLQNGSVKSDQSLRGVDADAEVDVMELGTTPHGPAEERQLWSLQDGMHVASRSGQSVRVLLRTRPDGSRFAVTQLTDVRDDIAGNMALRTLLPIAALIPCLLLVTALVVAGSLRPMVRLAGDLDLRRADDMTPLPLAGMPSELHPFIVSINGLLERMKLMMDQQRRFVADAAHELRTPITALSLQAENLDPVDLPEQARERLAALKQGTRRTKHLLEQLLALARHEVGPPCEVTAVPLDRIAKDSVADLLPDAARKGIDLGFALIEPIVTKGEPVMIAMMIRNLLDNAVRFTPQGGRVDIGVYREGNEAVVQIEDTGPGIPPGELDRIFEPFFRGSRPAEDGTGLGLAIVKRIVDRLGGGSCAGEYFRPTLERSSSNRPSRRPEWFRAIALAVELRCPLMGWSGRAPAPAASDAYAGHQRQGARHGRSSQDRLRRHRHRQKLVPRRRPICPATPTGSPSPTAVSSPPPRPA